MLFTDFKTHLFKIVTHLVLIIGVFITLFPLFWMISGSLKPPHEIFSTTLRLIPENPTLENYRFVFSTIPLLRELFNSIIIASSYTLLSLFFCSLAGFAFAKHHFPGRYFLFFFLLATMMVPVEVGIIPSFLIIKALKWVNTYYAVIIPGSASAFGIFFMRQYIATVPDEVIDAAKIDGCSDFRTYCQIILPIIKPALVALGIMHFMFSWNSFLWPLVVLRTYDMYTIVLGVNLIPAQEFDTPWGAVLAGCTVAVLPLIVFFLIFQKHFISGITLGAVKG